MGIGPIRVWKDERVVDAVSLETSSDALSWHDLHI